LRVATFQPTHNRWRVSANRGRGLSGRAARLVADPADGSPRRRGEGQTGVELDGYRLHVRKAKSEAGITLHECRHTYASFLMAAGYTLKEIMEFMGHADLQMVQRYVKLLPQPEESNPAERLNAYLRRVAQRPTR
jgi:integrase